MSDTPTMVALGEDYPELRESVCKICRNRLSGLIKCATSWPLENVSGLLQSPFGLEL